MTRAALARRAALLLLGTLAGLGLLALALGGRWTSLTHAVAAAPLMSLVAAALLQSALLVARSEAWNRCVRAAGGTVGRGQLYRIASLGYLGNVINGELGFAIRIGALRRTASPTPPGRSPTTRGARARRSTEASPIVCAPAAHKRRPARSAPPSLPFPRNGVAWSRAPTSAASLTSSAFGSCSPYHGPMASRMEIA